MLSPFAAYTIFKAAPYAAEAAEKLSGITVGADIAPKKNNSLKTDNIDDEVMLSHGFGWQEPEADEEETPADTMPTDEQPADPGVLPYPESLEQRSGSVIQTSYGMYRSSQYINLNGGGQVRNCTSVPNKSLEAQSTVLPQFKIDINSAPQVLIMHTHTTESFEPYERDFYDKSFGYRTTDNSKNVVMVGNEIKKQLEAAGIGVIHDKTVHDYPSYNGSYERSAGTVKAVLNSYPSIKVVLDIHRDAIYKNGSIMQPVAEINGKKAAQVMIISGCDDGTMGMPEYMQNFSLASLLQQQLEDDYKGLTRPVLFDYRKYNQNLTTGSLLLEIGSHGNTIEQARYAGELTGKALARALLKIKA